MLTGLFSGCLRTASAPANFPADSDGLRGPRDTDRRSMQYPPAGPPASQRRAAFLRPIGWLWAIVSIRNIESP